LKEIQYSGIDVEQVDNQHQNVDDDLNDRVSSQEEYGDEN
jgi:hypothetical protein